MKIPCLALAALLAACATAPPPAPPLRIDLSGQVIDRQFRELVVHVTNAGDATLRDVAIEITLPAALPLLREPVPPRVTRDAHVYAIHVGELAPGAATAVHFPFRTSASAALAERPVHVVARAGRGTVEVDRTIGVLPFPNYPGPEK
jgi:hypothetical protein